MPGVVDPRPVALSGNQQDPSERGTAPASQQGGATDACAALQKTCTDMLIVLELMRARQAETARDAYEKMHPSHNIHMLTQDIWARLQRATDDNESSGLLPHSDIGEGFLRQLYPTKANAMRYAYPCLEHWARTYPKNLLQYLWRGDSHSSLGDLANQFLDKNSSLWTDEWQPNDNVKICRIHPKTLVSDPFSYDVIDGGAAEQIYERGPEVLLPFSASLRSALKANTIAPSFLAWNNMKGYPPWPAV